MNEFQAKRMKISVTESKMAINRDDIETFREGWYSKILRDLHWWIFNMENHIKIVAIKIANR